MITLYKLLRYKKKNISLRIILFEIIRREILKSKFLKKEKKRISTPI